MDCPRRRRAAAILIAGLLGVGGLGAQEPATPPAGTKSPMVMPPRMPAPLNTPLPPTGVPVGTPISAGIPAGTQIKSIPVASGTPIPFGSTFGGTLPVGEMVMPAAPSPYFGFYPTTWRAFPEQACPPPYAPGQPLPTYPPHISSPDSPPLLKNNNLPVPTPNPLPLNVQQPPKTNVVPTEGYLPDRPTRPPSMLQQTSALPPLLPAEELKGPELFPVTDTKPVPTLATMGRPRLSSAPEPAPVIPPPQPIAPSVLAPAPVTPASAIDVPFVPATTKTGFASDQLSDSPAKERPPANPERPRVLDEDIFRPAPPVIQPGK